MTREDWESFICAPERAGRHLSMIGRGVSGSVSEPIDLAVLHSFLERLHNTTKDVHLLGSAVDLISTEYAQFASGPLHRILDALSNEVLSHVEVIGPGLRGNPCWDKTLLQRLSGRLSPVQYVSRTSRRTFEMPENQLLAWLVDDLQRTVSLIEHHVGTPGLHETLRSLRADCELARQHPWFGDVEVPRRLTAGMLAAARRHRRPEYRAAARLASHRAEMASTDADARLHTILSLLAVNWLEPVSDDDVFELYVLILVLDILTNELGFGEPEELGLVTGRRKHIAGFRDTRRTVRVFFDQAPGTVLGISTAYSRVLAQHRGVTGSERRPDILLAVEHESSTRLILVEMKKSYDGRYLADSIYKVFGYLFDFDRALQPAASPRAILIVPSGVSALPSTSVDLPLLISSGDDRAGVYAALDSALTA